jgi:hypothetical protein
MNRTAHKGCTKLNRWAMKPGPPSKKKKETNELSGSVFKKKKSWPTRRPQWVVSFSRWHHTDGNPQPTSLIGDFLLFFQRKFLAFFFDAMMSWKRVYFPSVLSSHIILFGGCFILKSFTLQNTLAAWNGVCSHFCTLTNCPSSVEFFCVLFT